MERINFRKEKIPFTQVANCVLFDPKLSAKAKGLYAYLYAKPDGWNFAIDRIAQEFVDGRKGINSGLRELEENGYLYREKQKTGRVLYILRSQMPQMDIRLQKPDAPKGKVPKRQSAERVTISNTDIKVIKNISNKDSKTTVLQASEWRELIDSFKEVNPMYTDFYKNKTERKALEVMVEKFGYTKVLSTIQALEEVTSQKTAPRITKPTELKRDLGKLLIFVKQQQSGLKTITKIG